MEKYLVTFNVEVFKQDTEKNIEQEIVKKIDWAINDGEDMFVDRDAVIVIKEKNNP
jgi:hypothetical protein